MLMSRVNAPHIHLQCAEHMRSKRSMQNAVCFKEWNAVFNANAFWRRRLNTALDNYQEIEPFIDSLLLSSSTHRLFEFHTTIKAMIRVEIIRAWVTQVNFFSAINENPVFIAAWTNCNRSIYIFYIAWRTASVQSHAIAVFFNCFGTSLGKSVSFCYSSGKRS